MGHKVQFAGVLLELEGDWRDITDTLPDGTPPTLARETGLGALQFSVAKYNKGKLPDIQRPHLERFLYYFEDAQGFERKCKTTQFDGKGTFGISCEYDLPSSFIRVWYVSDGMNLAFLTYTSTNDHSEAFQSELRQATVIAKSVQFCSRNS